jgi:2-keto-4-pentenoate hydratase
MQSERVAAAADALAAAWRGGARIPLPSVAVAPETIDEATAIQDALHQRLGYACVGWKLGMSSKAAQAANKLDGPFTGRLYKQSLYASPARFAADAFAHPVLEAEIAFRMARDLMPRAASYAEAEVLDAVAEAVLGIEVADNRYDARPPVPPLLLVADNGAAGAYITGPTVANWRELDLAAIEATLDINGRRAAESLTGDARCRPVPVLVWTANALSARGVGLKAGDLVTTGTACAPVPAGPGIEVVARFAGLGEVRIEIQG